MKPARLSAITLTLAAALVAFTGHRATADAVTAHHGGQVQDAGPYHLELVAKPNDITVYVTGSGNKMVQTQGATGSATVLSGKGKETVQLAPAGSNVLKGSGKFEIGADTKIVVSVTFPGQPPVQARFTPTAAAATQKSGK